MDAIAPNLFFWNSWVVLPVLALAAAVAYWRLRKRSLAVMFGGLVLMIVGEALTTAFPQPLHPAYLGGSVVGLIGTAAMAGGFAWFVWKDSSRPKNPTA